MMFCSFKIYVLTRSVRFSVLFLSSRETSEIKSHSAVVGSIKKFCEKPRK